MFSKETYISRRNLLKKTVGSGILLFVGNDETGMNYADNTYHFRQDSTFLYFLACHTMACRPLSILIKMKKSFLVMN